MGYDPLGASAEQYTTPTVVGEIRDRSASLRIQAAIETGALKVTEPSSESKQRVAKQMTQLGDNRKISATDLDILALALDLTASRGGCSLVTDDYAVQNVAHRMGIPFRSLATRGIRYEFKWLTYCSACGRSYPPGFRGNECTVCGTPLRRKVSRKKRIS
jgi:UPF0271 protein